MNKIKKMINFFNFSFIFIFTFEFIINNFFYLILLIKDILFLNHLIIFSNFIQFALQLIFVSCLDCFFIFIIFIILHNKRMQNMVFWEYNFFVE